jgi:hypothetical protein
MYSAINASEAISLKKDMSNLNSEWYSETYNIPIAEAKSRLSIIDHAKELAELVNQEEVGFADMYIEDEPNFKIIFNFKKNLKNKDVSYIKDFTINSDLENHLSINYVDRSLYDLRLAKEKVLTIFKI